MRHSLIVLCMLMAGSIQAQVYRSVDKDGNVVFSDKATAGAVEVQVKELETIKSLDRPPPESDSAPAANPEQQTFYTVLAIASPRADETIRENSGTIGVSVVLTPQLRPLDKMVVFLDGAEFTSTENQSLQLQNVDRGTHELKVTVVDADGKEQISSQPVTFHLQRFTALNPNAPKAKQP